MDLDCRMIFWFFLSLSVLITSGGDCYLQQTCEDLKRDTTYDDIDKIFDRFTKRFTGTLSFVGDYPSGLSSCRLDPLPPISKSIGWIPVAVGPIDYIHSLSCGTCLKISPRKNLKKRRNVEVEYDPTATLFATVVDQCKHCKAGDIEMYKEGPSDAHGIIYEAIDCPEISGEKGYLRIRTRNCENDDQKKIQVKNAKLPTLSLEIFQDDQWTCMKRTSDNQFLLSPSTQTGVYNIPLKARATSVTGQTLGFTINSLEPHKDVLIPAQYSPFDTVSSGKVPRLKCFTPSLHNKTNKDEDEYGLKARNLTMDDFHMFPNNKHLLTPSGHLIDKTPENPTSSQLDTFSRHNTYTTNKLNISDVPVPLLNRTSLTSVLLQRKSNSSLLISRPYNYKTAVQNTEHFQNKPCLNKLDGRYKVAEDCSAFYVCRNGIGYIKRCPKGLLFNPLDTVCDWSNHVNCYDVITKNDTIFPTANQNEIYTKKFVNRNDEQNEITTREPS